MFCPACGTRNDDAAAYCSRCGQRLDGSAPGQPPTDAQGAYVPPPDPVPASAPPPGGGDVGALGVVFFCLPIVGAIMYFVWRDEQPVKAKRACTLALWGLGVGIVLRMLMALGGY